MTAHISPAIPALSREQDRLVSRATADQIAEMDDAKLYMLMYMLGECARKARSEDATLSRAMPRSQRHQNVHRLGTHDIVSRAFRLVTKAYDDRKISPASHIPGAAASGDAMRA